MEYLGNILSSLNGNWMGFILIVITGLFLIIGVKKGYISFSSDKIKVGQDTNTRNLIQNQFEYAHAKIEGVISSLPENLDIYHTKYILARVEDVIQRAIIFNNMSTNKSYIKSKQELVYQTVMKRITDDWFKTGEFKQYCYSFVEELLRDLVDMKN